ncbi:methyltransferase (DUF5641) [Popillia japonica]|uniref:Methyltransferase (DUF5641) n=1 Tax=Popillia japonica TaxID=7064 RepID=A0AAW1KM25_POPJA
MLVLIKNDTVPPLQWKLGRICQLHPGTDGIARVASVRTQHVIPHRDTAIIMGDFIGKEELMQNIGGKNTMHKVTTDNGLRLCNLTSQWKMTLASTKFKHKITNKATWIMQLNITVENDFSKY